LQQRGNQKAGMSPKETYYDNNVASPPHQRNRPIINNEKRVDSRAFDPLRV
jgi:hypothetical protein